MKKLFFVLMIIFSAVFASGCAVQQVNTKNPVSSNNGNVNTDTQSVFEMKSKCVGYRNDIEKILEETSWNSYSIDEIFYSPIKNSCLYSVLASQKTYSAYIIWDYLTGEMIFYRDTTLTNGQDLSDIYRNAKSYLKGEGELKYTEKDWNLD